MRNRSTIIVALALIPACAFANRIQVWTQGNVSYGMAERLSAGLSQENRYGLNDLDGSKHVDEIHAAPSIDYACLGWLSVGANYRHVLLRSGSDARYVQDRRPGIDISLKEKAGRFSFLNRSRFICRVPEHEDPYFRYRNLSKVSCSFERFSPYVSYEFYFDEGSHDRPYRKNDRFSQQWLTFGTEWKLGWGMMLSTYYMLTENKDRSTHGWYPGHVVGISVSKNF